MNIKELLLIGIVQEYIKSKEPIGSEFLKAQQNFKVSSATIRNYFKILEKEGALYQPHISSGRIPTFRALQSYWRDTLSHLVEHGCMVHVQNLKILSLEYGVFCALVPKRSNVLEEILCFKSDYLILKFSRSEVVVNYSEALHRFTQSLVGVDVEEIVKISSNVGAGELKRKLTALEHVDLEENAHRFGVEFLNEIACGNAEYYLDFLHAKAFLKYANGIYFNQLLPEGYMGLIHDVVCYDKNTKQASEARMMCVGKLLTDYGSFYAELGC